LWQVYVGVEGIDCPVAKSKGVMFSLFTAS
jgi:hypothetical protein